MSPDQTPNPQPVPEPVPQQVPQTPPAPTPTPQPQPQPTQAPPTDSPLGGYVPSSSQQSVSSAQAKSGSAGKKIILVIAILVILAIVGGVAMLLMHRSSENPVSSLTSSIKGNDEVVSRSDGTLDLSNLIDKQSSIKNQDIHAKLNQQVNMSDGTSYMVTGVERNFSSTSRYLKPDTGKELIKVNIVVGNRNKESSAYISSSIFKIRNSAGGNQKSKYVTKDDIAGAYTGEDVAPGKQTKGILVFQVDKNEKVQAVVTDEQYESLSSDQKITIKSEVALQ